MSFGGLLGGVGNFIMGDSPQDLQKQAQQNEFRDVNQGQFISGYIPGLYDQTGALGRQMGGNVPQIGTSDFRGDQQFLLNQYRADMMGNGPAAQAAQRAAQAGAGSGIQNQLAMAAGTRGNTLAARTAANNAANISAQAGQQGSMGSLMAAQGAMAGFGNVAQGARSQDIQRAMANAGYTMAGRRDQLAAMQQQAMLAQLQQQGMGSYQDARTSRYNTIAGAAPRPTSSQQALGILVGAGEAYAGLPPTGAKGAAGQ